jgi:hypothetical protein
MGHLLLGKLKIKYISVGDDAIFGRGFRYGNEALI